MESAVGAAWDEEPASAVGYHYHLGSSTAKRATGSTVLSVCFSSTELVCAGFSERKRGTSSFALEPSVTLRQPHSLMVLCLRRN